MNPIEYYRNSTPEQYADGNDGRKRKPLALEHPSKRQMTRAASDGDMHSPKAEAAHSGQLLPHNRLEECLDFKNTLTPQKLNQTRAELIESFKQCQERGASWLAKRINEEIVPSALLKKVSRKESDLTELANQIKGVDIDSDSEIEFTFAQEMTDENSSFLAEGKVMSLLIKNSGFFRALNSAGTLESIEKKIHLEGISENDFRKAIRYLIKGILVESDPAELIRDLTVGDYLRITPYTLAVFGKLIRECPEAIIEFALQAPDRFCSALLDRSSDWDLSSLISEDVPSFINLFQLIEELKDKLVKIQAESSSQEEAERLLLEIFGGDDPAFCEQMRQQLQTSVKLLVDFRETARKSAVKLTKALSLQIVQLVKTKQVEQPKLDRLMGKVVELINAFRISLDVTDFKMPDVIRLLRSSPCVGERLEYADFGSLPMNDYDFKYCLDCLGDIKHLRISGNSIMNGISFRCLPKFGDQSRRLESLHLENCQLDARHLNRFEGMPIKHLYMNNCFVNRRNRVDAFYHFLKAPLESLTLINVGSDFKLETVDAFLEHNQATLSLDNVHIDL